MSDTSSDAAAARCALVAALKTVGIELDPADDDAGLVMKALRKEGYRIRKMSPSQLKKHLRHLDECANGSSR